ncbi:MAG TPA: response regulator, partial [Polyangiales bacterium]|nr:response regulator [Polyangiales bacterium]
DETGKMERAVGAVLDVTELREATELAQRTTAQLAEAQRIGRMGSFEVDVPGRRATWSDELYRILDVDRTAAPTIDAFLERLHDDDRDRVAAAIDRAWRAALPQPCRARIVCRDGSVRHIDITALALHDSSGKLHTLRGTVADVTELVRLEAQFHQSQKMEAVGQLAGGLAHDYNNLLMVISGNAELLLDRFDAPEARQILTAAQAATSLTQRLLTFSRQNTQRTRVVELARELEECKPLFQRALGEGVALRIELDPDVDPVRVDSGQLQQILLNLALNARDAMPDGGSFTLRASNRQLSDGAAQHISERAGDYVTLRVMDTGSGMDEATRRKAFEPFFTTKPLGRGTGLGLSMVFGAMKQCGGFVELESQPRVGSTFTLWFPRAIRPAQQEPEHSSEPPRATASVLLVEDNEAVASVATRILESAGYSVRTTHVPEQALRICQTAPPDVLITDVEMPGMSGVKLSALLREREPELPVLYITGHSTERIELGEPDARTAIVMKPFRRSELLLALAELLGRT